MSRPADPARPDLYTRITDSIIAQLKRFFRHGASSQVWHIDF